ncbi:hypothetical protein BBO99_00004946 [Phytophthora kernoviae]|uniref:Uncharacterized protein n=2 Tax=Phytophthora kernoviae TaxID=325452 RepID=A0A3R7MK66_9STRA|nr:hypothetical protein G195_005405 [Phytophthora kernoviae 00238/432]KAG2525397.1 hypothetical protein JM16_004463 [Phytophthora kernoviae]KAG2527215.1 hypothetical protein JM18_003962 [Phytophthora kernoviae]RLM97627.1 hypothetical protein BBI17_004984 [Phytophthora kernoviae]RLN79871.1 hypothetical protein BBO99_00004946 [Phytophthora kernoviae]
MAKQVNYFDGEQKRAYADQLDKLERELEAYLRTGNEPTEEFLRALDAEAAAIEPEPEPEEQVEADSTRSEIGNEDEEKEVRRG